MRGRKWSDKKHRLHEERFSGENHPLWGTHRSNETKVKIGNANRGKKRSLKFIEQLIARNASGKNVGEKNSMFGKHHTEETKEKIRIAALKRKINPMKGKKHSEETRQKISKNHKRTAVKSINAITGDIREYVSLCEAEKEGFYSSAILKCCKGKQNIHKGYFWQYEKETRNKSE